MKTLILGPIASGKTTLAEALTARSLAQGRRAIYIDDAQTISGSELRRLKEFTDIVIVAEADRDLAELAHRFHFDRVIRIEGQTP